MDTFESDHPIESLLYEKVTIISKNKKSISIQLSYPQAAFEPVYRLSHEAARRLARQLIDIYVPR